MYDSSYSPSVKVIHAADLHLDSPFVGIERIEGAPVGALTGATREAFVNLVDYALGERVDLVLLAGDVYDGEWRDYHTGLFFARQLKRLREAAIKVVMVKGNHDAQSSIPKHLPLPENATLLSHSKPQAFLLDELGVVVTGQSFAQREVTNDLSQGFPPPMDGYLNFALLHTGANGRPGHANYAPCNPAQLALAGYDYWALGHVHAREILNEAPWIVFAGNLQGRHVRETGPKGFFLIEAVDGSINSVTPVDIDVVRWAVLEVDASEAATPDDVVEQFASVAADEVATADGRMVAARVVVSGATSAHAALTRDPERLRAQVLQAAIEVADAQLWVEKVKLKTSGPREVTQLLARDHPLTEIVRSLRGGQDEDTLAALADALAPLRKKLPLELRTTSEGVELGGPEHLAQLLPRIEEMLLAQLIGEEAAA